MLPRVPVPGVQQVPSNSRSYNDLEMMRIQSLNSQPSRPVAQTWNHGTNNNNGIPYNNQHSRVFKSSHGTHNAGLGATGKSGQAFPGYVKYSQHAPLQIQPPQPHHYQNSNNQNQYQNSLNQPFPYNNNFQSNTGLFTTSPQAESSDTSFADLLSSHPIYNAVFDLRRLGLSFEEILKQSGVKPDILRHVYKMMGYPVHPEVISAPEIQLQAPIPVSVPPLKFVVNSSNNYQDEFSSTVMKPSITDLPSSTSVSSLPTGLSSASVPSSIPSSSLSTRNSTPSLSSLSNSSRIIRSHSVEGSDYIPEPKRAKFGSTNWRRNLIINITDDEDSDSESLDTEKIISSAKTSRPSSAMAADVDANLKAKRDEIKRMTELLAKMKSKKISTVITNEKDNLSSIVSSPSQSLSSRSRSTPLVSKSPLLVQPQPVSTKFTYSKIEPPVSLPYIPEINELEIEIIKVKTKLPIHTTVASQLSKQFDNLRSDTMKAELTLKKETVERDTLAQRVSEMKILLEAEQLKLSQKQQLCDSLSLRIQTISQEKDIIQTRITEERTQVKRLSSELANYTSELIKLRASSTKPALTIDEPETITSAETIVSFDLTTGTYPNQELNIFQSVSPEADSVDNDSVTTNEVKLLPEDEETDDIIPDNTESDLKTISRQNVDEDEEIIASLLSKTNQIVEPIPVSRFQPPKELIGRIVYVQPKTFTPYKSPLRSFRSFRFSPAYKSSAAPVTGYRSLTYSCKTPSNNNVLCKYETNGGSCNDETCQQIHFRNFIMSVYLDSEILAELSKAFIGETPEEIQKYRDSFSNELKLLKSTDFDTLADFIIKFRSDYQLEINGQRGQTFCDKFLDWYKFDRIRKRSELKSNVLPTDET